MKKFQHNFIRYEFPQEEYNYNNKTNPSVVCLVQESGYGIEDEKQIYHRVLNALQLGDSVKIEIIQLKDNQYLILSKQKNLRPNQIISFGIEPKRLGINGCESYYKYYQLDDFRIIFSESGEQLKDDMKKRLLWAGLKKMFGIP
ncbi:MAG TPA: hypothetical protein PK006_00890 [Saprospiraceae bacterium]|nr:hypothetical protein [Saprospiraceae bacterium]